MLRSIPFRMLAVFLSLWTALISIGCVSGGFQLTRTYARFVNSQMIIIRIILYLLTGVVFVATLLIDVVFFNTMDFWQGRVSQGTYEFKSDGKTFVAQHSVIDGCRQSRIEINGPSLPRAQVVLLRETANHEIELFVDGALKARVSNIANVPEIAMFNYKGEAVQVRPLFPEAIASR